MSKFCSLLKNNAEITIDIKLTNEVIDKKKFGSERISAYEMREDKIANLSEIFRIRVNR